MFNTEHSIVNPRNIHQFHNNLTISMRVRTQIDKQTEFTNPFQLCWKVLNSEQVQ